MAWSHRLQYSLPDPDSLHNLQYVSSAGFRASECTMAAVSACASFGNSSRVTSSWMAAVRRVVKCAFSAGDNTSMTAPVTCGTVTRVRRRTIAPAAIGVTRSVRDVATEFTNTVATSSTTPPSMSAGKPGGGASVLPPGGELPSSAPAADAALKRRPPRRDLRSTNAAPPEVGADGSNAAMLGLVSGSISVDAISCRESRAGRKGGDHGGLGATMRASAVSARTFVSKSVTASRATMYTTRGVRYANAFVAA